MNLTSIALLLALVSPPPGAVLLSPPPDRGEMYPIDTNGLGQFPKLPHGVALRGMHATIVGYRISDDASGKPLILLDLRREDGSKLTARLAVPIRIDNRQYLCSGCRSLPKSVLGHDALLLYWKDSGSGKSAQFIVDQISTHTTPFTTPTPER